MAGTSFGEIIAVIKATQGGATMPNILWPALALMRWTRFLRRIGVHFDGKCCGCLRWNILAVSLLASTYPASAEYRLNIGDVIEISMARLPELKHRVPVQLDGTISFPLLGTLSVAGLTPSDAQASIQAALATKVFRQRAWDGRENAVVIEPDEVAAVVVEYRPIYVNGDVSRPGEQAYRPLMTVRQAVALSGGYDLMRANTNNPLQSAELVGDYELHWIAFAKEQAHVWRLRAELDDKNGLDQSTLLDAPLPRSAVSEIMSLESEQLKARQADYERERAFLRHAIKQAGEQIEVLTVQEQKEEQGAQADADELQRSIDLYGKGSLPSPRVMDARRALLLSSTRRLQTAAQLVQVRRQLDDLSRQLERLGDQRRINLLRELQDAGVRLGESRARLRSIGEKLQYTALVRSRLARGNGNKPEITILRKGAKGWEHLIAEEETELRPGDVVEVALRSEPAAGDTVQ
jgi:polysaccharide export outer membrane protein